MHVTVRKRYRLGKAIPDREVLSGPAQQGTLILATTQTRSKNWVATFELIHRGMPGLNINVGRLYQPKLLTNTNRGFVFKGIESIKGKGVYQEWDVEILGL